ncbi:cystatin-SN [Amia ocellicauda]|uniref:cystatin-SN n=1 Tax=Amia ocellicauda TaxID=2972642 RepID=UPI00346402FF
MALQMILCLFSLMSVLAVDEPPLEEKLIEEIRPSYTHPVGAPFEMDPNSTEIQMAAKDAVDKYNKKSKAKKYFKLIKVVAAEAQVTNTITYKLSAEIGKSICKKNEDVDLESCAFGKKRFICQFEISIHPATNHSDLHESNCKKLKCLTTPTANPDIN